MYNVILAATGFEIFFPSWGIKLFSSDIKSKAISVPKGFDYHCVIETSRLLDPVTCLFITCLSLE